MFEAVDIDAAVARLAPYHAAQLAGRPDDPWTARHDGGATCSVTFEQVCAQANRWHSEFEVIWRSPEEVRVGGWTMTRDPVIHG